MDNTSTELSDYLIIDDSIHINGLEWGTMVEDATEFLGALDETKPETHYDTFVTRKWPVKQLRIEELDIVSNYMLYFFDEEEGFYSVWVNFYIGSYDHTNEIYDQMKEFFGNQFAIEYQFKERRDTYVLYDNERYLLPNYGWKTIEVVPISFTVQIEPSNSEEYNIMLQISKARTIFR